MANAVTFYSHINRPKTVPCTSGSEYINTYIEQVKNGRKGLQKTGKTNVYEKIQKHLESTKIENILHSIAMGDLSVLRSSEPVYADATTMPKSLMEAQNLVLRMKQEFEKMPTEIKELFHNSCDEYVEKMGTDEFKNIMSPYNEKVAKIAAEKNHAEYEKKVKEGAKLNYDIAREQAMLGGET